MCSECMIWFKLINSPFYSESRDSISQFNSLSLSLLTCLISETHFTIHFVAFLQNELIYIILYVENFQSRTLAISLTDDCSSNCRINTLHKYILPNLRYCSPFTVSILQYCVTVYCWIDAVCLPTPFQFGFVSMCCLINCYLSHSTASMMVQCVILRAEHVDKLNYSSALILLPIWWYVLLSFVFSAPLQIFLAYTLLICLLKCYFLLASILANFHHQSDSDVLSTLFLSANGII